MDQRSAGLVAHITELLPHMSPEVARKWSDNPDSLRAFLEKLLLADTTIRVDRSIRPTYPDWVEKVLFPHLEASGPYEYDIAGLCTGCKVPVSGDFWSNFLNGRTALLGASLNLRDGEEISRKGILVFREYFASRFTFLLKSLVRGRDSMVYVPGLCEKDGTVTIVWHNTSQWHDMVWGVHFQLPTSQRT